MRLALPAAVIGAAIVLTLGAAEISKRHDQTARCLALYDALGGYMLARYDRDHNALPRLRQAAKRIGCNDAWLSEPRQ